MNYSVSKKILEIHSLEGRERKSVLVGWVLFVLIRRLPVDLHTHWFWILGGGEGGLGSVVVV